jgi:signal transduction histidine kinase
VIEEKAAHVFVAAYRGFALVVATVQIFFVGDFQVFATHDWVLFGLVGAYTLFKVSRPLRPYRRTAFTYADFAFDLALCASLPPLTGGLHSPFLLYCLCPVLTSALFFPRKVTFSIAGIPVVILGVSQLLLYPTLTTMEWYPLGLSIGLLAAVLVASFLIAWLPYIININASQTIRRQAILSERSRLSREIHDGVAQSLGIIHWKMEQLLQTIANRKMSQALFQVTEAKGLVEEAQQELKEAIDELRASTEGKQGFVPTLARYATEFTQTYGIRCELHVADGQVNLPLPAELELLRIAREALSNVRRHAAASRVEVTFESKKECVEMTIKDNGSGFDAQAGFQGHGLAVMEERALSLGGELAITTGLGQGTAVRVRLPAPETQRGDYLA